MVQDHGGGVNHTHLVEPLADRKGMVLSRSTVSRLLLGAGVLSLRRRRPLGHRCQPRRMPREGILLRLDGSHHSSLEDRGPVLTLLVARAILDGYLGKLTIPDMYSLMLGE